MLKKEILKNLKSELESTQDNLVFYDDDPDGLISFILLKKKYPKIKGNIIKGPPFVEEKYLSKVKIINPDKIIVLDKPGIQEEFVNNTNKPIIWVDHHEPTYIKGVKYFNPRAYNPKDRSPVSYIIYKTVGGPLWLAMIGVIGDWYIPKELKILQKQFPKLLPNIKSPPEVLYDTEFGKLIKIIAFLLKQDIKDIKKSIDKLIKIESPEEILKKTSREGKSIHNHFLKIDKKYQVLLKNALKKEKKGLLLFTYSGEDSFTGELSNELLHKSKSRFIIIGREKDDEIRMSIRSKKTKIPPILKKALTNIRGYGGGHEHACGANVKINDFDKFIKQFTNLIKK